jgi:hypothetical protein
VNDDEGGAGPSVSSSLALVRWRLVGCALGLLFYAGLWLCVVAGATGLEGALITIPAIVALVAGGNWLQHWLGVQRRAPQFSRPGGDPDRDEDGASP